MIKITNGRVTLMVTPGAYKDIYASQGFHQISELVTKATETSLNGPEPQNDTAPDPDDEDSSEDNSGCSEDNQDEDLSEVPLNEMDSDQLREYAKKLGVDIRGLTSKKAVRDKIRSVL